MEAGTEIARTIMQSRSMDSVSDGQNLVNTAIKEAGHILSTGNPVAIRTLLVHRECLLASVQCTHAMLIEIWTIKSHCDRRSDQITALDPFFLKNAVRSHLYFSQLNSWMTNNGGQLPNGLVFVYRLECLEVADDLSKLDKDGSDEDLKKFHTFPVAKCGLSLLTVSVKWKKFSSPPVLPSCSSFESSRFPLQEWVSPLESVSSNSSFSSLNESVQIASSAIVMEKCALNEFVAEDDEDSSGIYSASTSSHEPSLFCYGSNQSLNELTKMQDPGKGSALEAQLSSHKNRPHNLATDLDRPSKKRNFFDDNVVGSITLNSPTMRLLDQLDQYATAAKVAKATEVESLADALAESSSLTGRGLMANSSFLSRRQSLPRRCRILSAFRFMSGSSTVFSKKTGLPLNSSPAPFSRREKNLKMPSISSSNGTTEEDSGASDSERLCSTKAVPTNSGLLCNFEESILNGRIEPLASVEGFHLQLTASGSFCSPHISVPVEAYSFNFSDDNAPSPYFGRCTLEKSGRKGYHIPKKGVIQATLFNPQGTVVCLFVVRFDVTEMPPSCQTFLRQRQFFMPRHCSCDEISRSWLRYLIHLRLATDRRCRLYIHSDIRMLFSQKGDLEGLNVELLNKEEHFELRTFTEMPQKPRFSPRK